MGSGVIHYKYEKRKKFEDYDEKADAELGTIKIRHYHFDNKSFVHPLQYWEELHRYPEYSPTHSGHASAPSSPEGSSEQQPYSHDASSYDLSGVWQPPPSCRSH
ncbi:hypothetical protein PIB30_032399 [Stylosanthes scabra]|uniref:Uncharacterized protein n=1 Tax=Stylosanthes scabra TaxID=79078 RepID=A0ABU6XBC5_9FABA|nr:hypothetical protein [Stylosanthes scabra]